MTRGRSGGVWEFALPRRQVHRVDFDVGEKVLPGTWDPRLGNEGTTLERVS